MPLIPAAAMKVLRVVVLLASMQHGRAVSAANSKGRIKGTHLEVRPISVARCTHLQHALAEVNVTYRMSGRTRVAMDVVGFVNRAAKQYTQMHITLTRCKDVVSEKSCSVAVPAVVPKEGICPAVLAPLMPWSDLVSKFVPPARCPIQEGNFSARNFFLDTTGVETLLSRETKSNQLEGYLWLARGMMFDHDLIHLCFECVFEFVRARNTAG